MHLQIRSLALLLLLEMQTFTWAADRVNQFGRDVLPILSENCLACHGPDVNHRKADLRLDTREGALQALDLKDPNASELLRRIESDDPDETMPPPSSHKKKLSPAQVDTLRRWIANGAPWGQHWSFEKPVQRELPLIEGQAAVHPVDAWIRSRLRDEGLQPSPPAAPYTLLRRLSFDLTGLPPTSDELKSFLNECQKESSKSNSASSTATSVPPQVLQSTVRRLLASPHYGERMAMWWLDAARYADTDGFQGDDTRTNWPWRDWVVKAFNDNMSFQQFTIEQFAGDLLPNATPEQRLATCFHRNHMTNGEGGRDPEESRVDYVMDRVSSTGTVWLGLTLGCCQCHSHKFDPVSQHEFYSLSAFFNSIDEDGKAGKNAKPYLEYESPRAPRAVEESQRLVDLRKPRERSARKAAEPPFNRWLAQKQEEVRNGFVAWHGLENVSLEAVEGTQLMPQEDGSILATGPNPVQDDYRVSGRTNLPRLTGIRIQVLPSSTNTDGKLSRGKSGEFLLTDVKVQTRKIGSSQVKDILVASAAADVSSEQKESRAYGDVKGILDDDPRNGWTTNGHDPLVPHTAVLALAEPLELDHDEQLVVELRQRSTLGDSNIGRFRITVSDQPGPAVQRVSPAPLEELAELHKSGSSEVPDDLRKSLFEQFLSDYQPYQVEHAALDRAQKQLKETEAAAKKINVMVLQEKETPRDTHVLLRGVWDKKGDLVKPGFPPAIAPFPTSIDQSQINRETLARWIVSRDNPLAARVFVNHIWQLLFGSGLVRTVDDFGLQGERPTHPELLDWLAVDFMENNWDVKRLIERIVTSQTYQQSSHVTTELLNRDPENRLLARASRFRLPSWMLRDAALQASGLLNPALGGPPVRPYQPDGVWEEMFMGRFRYDPSEGRAQYRRTLYAFWRRAIAPTFLFDSAQRRVCEVRTVRTNTPLQALTLLNDTNYLVASHALAKRAAMSSQSRPEVIRMIFLHALSRAPDDHELSVMMREYQVALEHYRQNVDASHSLLRELNRNPDGDPDIQSTDQQNSVPVHSLSDSELAALSIVASLVLNLDEAMNHE